MDGSDISVHLRKIANDISSGEDEFYSDDSQEWGEADEDIDFNNVDSQLRKLDSVALKGQVEEVNQKVIQKSNKKTNLVNPIKMLVSKQKRRFNLDGFDLDLTYVTEKIIAMGFPAESIESIYRNSMTDVVRFFNSRHPGHYKIYNLCAERKYKHSNFNNMVSEYPFEDHQAPLFELIFDFCKNVDDWLKAHPDNVAGIHCKAGKGRTGVMICCFLLYSKIFTNSYDALKYYSMIRTKNTKGVTIPSQIRYVHYFEKTMKSNWTAETIPSPTVELTKIKLLTIPNFSVFGGCEPFFILTNKQYLLNSKDIFKLVSYKSEAYIEFNLSGIMLKGDVLLEFYNNSLMKKEKMFQFWFNCAFFDQTGTMVIDKFMLDKACKDKTHKKFNKDFHIELYAKIIDEKADKLSTLNIQKTAPSRFSF